MSNKVNEWNIFEEIDKVEDEPKITKENMESISNLGRKQSELEKPSEQQKDLVNLLVNFIRKNKISVPSVEAALNVRKQDLFKIKNMELPEAMKNIGMNSFEMESGAKIEIKSDVSVSVPAEKRIEFNSWMIRKGHQDLIKNKVVVQFPKEGRQSSRRFVKYLSRYYANKGTCNYEEKEEIHPQTLKSFVKRLLREGGKLPLNLINIHEYSFTKIK